MTLGEKIKILRAKKEITQEGLAEELNVSRSTIAKWEANNGLPEINNLKEISKIFHISVDMLIDDTKNMDSVIDEVEYIRNCSTLVCDGKFYDIDLKGWSTGV